MHTTHSVTYNGVR